MRICSSTKCHKFSSVAQGETFVSCDKLFMRTKNVYNENGRLIVNAVQVENGETDRFDPETPIQPIACMVVFDEEEDE